MRFFNTAGPIKPEIHYCVPMLDRLDLGYILPLIEQQKYFVLHAPRQTGKTSCLLALMRHLNATGQYRCVYINVELAQSARENVDAAMRAILNEIASGAAWAIGDDFPNKHRAEILTESGGHAALQQILSLWSQNDPRPVVLLVDEIDSLDRKSTRLNSSHT